MARSRPNSNDRRGKFGALHCQSQRSVHNFSNSLSEERRIDLQWDSLTWVKSTCNAPIPDDWQTARGFQSCLFWNL
ncbi:MAG: hypothetical protein NVS1B6_09950 [Steroidobacteraceae bacterium]